MAKSFYEINTGTVFRSGSKHYMKTYYQRRNGIHDYYLLPFDNFKLEDDRHYSSVPQADRIVNCELIYTNKRREDVPFYQMNNGDIFECDGEVYMKTYFHGYTGRCPSDDEDERDYMLNMKTGELTPVYSRVENKCERLNCKIIFN